MDLALSKPKKWEIVRTKLEELETLSLVLV